MFLAHKIELRPTKQQEQLLLQCCGVKRFVYNKVCPECGGTVKRLIGTGYWFRGQHELLLLGTKGKPPIPCPEHRVSSVLTKQRTEHSKKPKDYYSIIEKMVEPPRLELFAREKREGWDAWGNQVPPHCQKLLATDGA